MSAELWDWLTALDGPVTDERFACGLLRDHLTKCGASGFQCKVNEADPPDLVVTWENGAQWGVEVTRTYQQVASFDGGEPVSSEQIAATLRNFAEQLGKKTQGIRKCGYTLSLEGPGRFSSWKSPVSKKRWREETEETIRRHIVSKESGILRIPGVWLKPGEPGTRWTILTSAGVSETSLTTDAMVRRALKDKALNLQRWDGSFAERWLLLLNCYPLVEDLAQVEDTLHQLILKHPELAGFNGIFWSGPPDYPDWKLISISLSCPGTRGDDEQP